MLVAVPGERSWTSTLRVSTHLNWKLILIQVDDHSRLFYPRFASDLVVFRGMVVNVGQPISHRLDHLLSGVNAQIALKVFGDDLATLREKAEEVRTEIATVPGVTDLFVEKQVLIPQIRIQIHREAAKTYGIQVGDLAGTLGAALYGESVTEVLDGQKTYEVVVN